MTICYYVTGHGLGHSIRTAQVINALPTNIPIIIRTTVPERIFREEIQGRDFEYISAEFDCGCIQTDSTTILKRETLQRYIEISKKNYENLDDEIEFLHERDVSLVVSDIASFPLVAAKKASVASVAATNFTWWDIYNEYVETTDDRRLLDKIGNEYACADLALVSDLCLPTTAHVFPNTLSVPLTTRTGKNRRHELDIALTQRYRQQPADKAPNLALLYLGVWGLDIDWDEVEKLSDWRFVSYDALPRPVRNVTVLDRSEWPVADTIASLDAMLSKVGYGSTTDCIANSIPNIHLPRKDFIEYEALIAGMDIWGGRIGITEEMFIKGNWKYSLEKSKIVKKQIKTDKFKTNGAQIIAKVLVEIHEAAREKRLSRL
jgi:L-arabinokinase